MLSIPTSFFSFFFHLICHQRQSYHFFQVKFFNKGEIVFFFHFGGISTMEMGFEFRADARLLELLIMADFDTRWRSLISSNYGRFVD